MSERASGVPLKGTCCTVLYCTVLYCTVLYCAMLHRAVMCYAVLYCTVLCCAVLYYEALRYAMVSCAMLYCAVLHHSYSPMHPAQFDLFWRQCAILFDMPYIHISPSKFNFSTFAVSTYNTMKYVLL